MTVTFFQSLNHCPNHLIRVKPKIVTLSSLQKFLLIQKMEDVNQSKTAVTAARSAARKTVGTPSLENLKNSKKKKKKLPFFDIQPHNLKIRLKTSCLISSSLSSRARKSHQHLFVCGGPGVSNQTDRRPSGFTYRFFYFITSERTWKAHFMIKSL